MKNDSTYECGSFFSIMINLDNAIKCGKYDGHYVDEMRILEFLSGGFEDKEVLLVGAGHEPDDNMWAMNNVLVCMKARVYAVDVRYDGPAECDGVRYYRGSVHKLSELFLENRFDIVISTAMFGVPFTNWAIREYGFSPHSEDLGAKIQQKELESLKQALIVAKPGTWNFHHNVDLNPQSWTFTKEDLLKIGFSVAFQPESPLESRKTWFMKK